MCVFCVARFAGVRPGSGPCLGQRVRTSRFPPVRDSQCRAVDIGSDRSADLRLRPPSPSAFVRSGAGVVPVMRAWSLRLPLPGWSSPCVLAIRASPLLLGDAAAAEMLPRLDIRRDGQTIDSSQRATSVALRATADGLRTGTRGSCRPCCRDTACTRPPANRRARCRVVAGPRCGCGCGRGQRAREGLCSCRSLRRLPLIATGFGLRRARCVRTARTGRASIRVPQGDFDVLARGVVERPVQPRVSRTRDLRDDRQSRRVDQVQRRVTAESGVTSGVRGADDSQHRYRVGVQDGQDALI
jgi:hypothetical protein